MKNNNRLVIIATAALLVVGILLLIISSSVFNRQSVDDFPEDGAGIDITSQALIVNGEELLDSLGSAAALENYSKDLYSFGITAYEPYRNNETDLVGFEVLKVENAEDEILVTGKYGSSNNEIYSTIKPLKHNRLNVSITDTKTELNIDDVLPSNTKLNSFIGTLPVRGTNYEIDYFSDSDAFFINVFNTPNGNNEAETVIKNAIGEEKFNEVEILRFGVGYGNGGSNFGL
jgi:hypothetical protein